MVLPTTPTQIKNLGSVSDQIASFPDLIGSVSRRDFSIFIGAGISREVGYPGWAQLLTAISKKLGIRTTLNLVSPLEVAEYLWSKYLDLTFGRTTGIAKNLMAEAEQEFNALVIDQLEEHKSDQEKPIWFDSLSAILPSDVITTNYDNVVESVLFNRTANVVPLGAESIPRTEGRPTVYKIHGDIDDYRYLVFTQSQYEEWDQVDRYIPSKIKTLFIEKPTLCLGYSFRDPNVQLEHSRVFRSYAANSQPLYLVFDPAHVRKNDWGELIQRRDTLRSRNVHIIFGSTVEFLESIREHVQTHQTSAEWQSSKLSNVESDLKEWLAACSSILNQQSRRSILDRSSASNPTDFARGLIALAEYPEVRAKYGMGESDGLDHVTGVCIFEDLPYLMETFDTTVNLGLADFRSWARALGRFTTHDPGASLFSQAPTRLRLLFSNLGYLHPHAAASLATPIKEMLYFAGEGLGYCWGCWAVFKEEIKTLPTPLLRAVLRETVDADNWATRKEKITKHLEIAVGSTAKRVKLLSEHPMFDQAIS